MPNIAEYVANLLQGIKGQKPVNPQIGQSSQDVLAGAPQSQQPGLITGLPQTPNLNPQMPLGGPTNLNVQGPNVQTGVGLPPPPQFPQLASRPQDAANVDSTEQQDAIKRLDAQQALIDQDNQQAQSAFQKAQGQLGSEPTPNIGESLGGLITQFTGPRTPLAFTRAGGAPYELASERLALQNKNALDTMNASRAVLGLNVTRQDALDRTRATMVDNMSTQQARTTVAQIKGDAQFWTKLVQMTGTNPADPGTIMAALHATHPELSDDVIAKMTPTIAADPQTASTQYQYLQKQKADAMQQKVISDANAKIVSDARTMIQNPNATVMDKAAAYYQLQKVDVLPPNFDINAAIHQEGAVTKKNEAEASERTAKGVMETEQTKDMAAKLKPEVSKILAQTRLDEANYRHIVKETSSFDAVMQAKVAKDWASVYSLRGNSPKAQLTGLNQLANTYQRQIASLESAKMHYETANYGTSAEKWTAQDEERLQNLTDTLNGTPDVKDANGNITTPGKVGILESIQAAQQQLSPQPTGNVPVNPFAGQIGNTGKGTKPSRNLPPSPDRQPQWTPPAGVTVTRHG